jgi:predicted nucleotidyltransferase
MEPVVHARPTPASDAAEVRARLRESAERLRGLGVRRLGLFGSFARDEMRPESDVDLLVEFVPGEKSFDHFMALAFLLDELLQRRVELVTRDALSPHIGPRILAEVQDVPLGD